ncbi:MAG: DUF1007 family protein, partial [Acetobacterales bacterium]
MTHEALRLTSHPIALEDAYWSVAETVKMDGRPMRHLLPMVALLLLAALWPAGAAAHPHAWIDVEVTVRFDAEGRIAALEQRWLFDAGYTAAALQDMGIAPGGDPDPDKLNAFAQRAIDNLGPYGYFTEVRAGDERIAAGAIAELSGAVQDNRLLMRFTMPLA